MDNFNDSKALAIEIDVYKRQVLIWRGVWLMLFVSSSFSLLCRVFHLQTCHILQYSLSLIHI